MSEKKDTGNIELLAAGGLGAYGATTLVTAGFVCPSCLVIAPALLALGGYKKYKALQTDKEDHQNQTQT